MLNVREVKDPVYRAKKFAVKAHGDQKYGEEFPYAMHLQAVESVLLRFSIFDETLRVVAWLHDTLEDTDVQYEDIVTFFNRDVADIVALLTEPKGGNRKWRHEQTYPKIANNVNAIIVKLADRIANVESGGDKTSMYRKEYAHFKSSMQQNLSKFSLDDVAQIETMFDYLDSLLIDVDSDQK